MSAVNYKAPQEKPLHDKDIWSFIFLNKYIVRCQAVPSACHSLTLRVCVCAPFGEGVLGKFTGV